MKRARKSAIIESSGESGDDSDYSESLSDKLKRKKTDVINLVDAKSRKKSLSVIDITSPSPKKVKTEPKNNPCLARKRRKIMNNV